MPGLLGSKDIIVKIMGNVGFAFIARLSFTGYLIHYMVVSFSYYTNNNTVFVEDATMIYYWIANAVFSLFFALVLSTFVELPFMNLEGIIFNQIEDK